MIRLLTIEATVGKGRAEEVSVRRRSLLKGLIAAAVLPVAGCDGSTSGTGTKSPGSTGSYSLVFDASKYTVKAKTVDTGHGTRKVTYRFYRNNVYVRNPVDYQYQSLNVSVPIEIDGKPVDASGAPIMFSLNIGGYTSSSTWDATEQGGGGPGGGGAPGGAGGAPGGGSSAAPGGDSGPPGGSAPSGAGASGSGTTGNGAAPGQGITVNGGQQVDNGSLALAAGYVVVEPGARGRDNQWKNGRYYGKAPAAIVDLKSAVRYIRYNKGRLPGNPDWIIATGGSAGGALSVLVAASGDSPLYDPYLRELGAASESDAVFASASYSPITDLNHADMPYEWMLGELPLSTGKLVNQTYSGQLKDAFAVYQKSLGLRGLDNFGTLAAGNYAGYLMRTYLEPSATKKLSSWSQSERATYLKENPWITWSGGKAAFTWAKFLDHIGTRLKNVPAFDTFNLTAAENIEFGDATTNARHFTLYSLRHVTGNPHAQLASDLPAKLSMMNPMYFIGIKNPARARNWWIRTGTLDTNTSHVIVGNLAAGLAGLGDNVNSSLYWDGGHAVNEDAPEFIAWIATLTGYRG